MKRLMICAGESSGDSLAVELLKELAARGHPVLSSGMAGPGMRAFGVECVVPAEDATGVGLVEVISGLPRFASVLRTLRSHVLDWKPDALLTIDSPELLLRLGRSTRGLGVPVAHWVSPQVWAWRPGRVHRIARSADVLLCLFAHEPALYANTGVDARFVGHPAAAETWDSGSGAADSRPTIGMLPGSRPSEIRRHWPILVELASQLKERLPGCEFVVPVAETVAAEELTGFSFRRAPPVARKRLEVDVAVAASGTVTLELALQGVPMVVFYRVHPMTWHIGRRLVTGISSLALPNILLNQQVVPEHVQHVKPTLVADEVVRLLGEEGHVQRLAFKALVDSVGPGDASSRAADILEEMLTLPHVEPDRRGEAHA